MLFRVAIVGHSQVPKELPNLPNAVQLQVFRAPGARAHSFFSNDVLTAVFNHRFDLVILWIGSNDIHSRCNVAVIVDNIKAIVKQLEDNCTPKVKICLIEPRRLDPGRRPHLDQDHYNKIAKAINNKMQKRALKHNDFITLGARPFFENLRRDGVHFNHQAQEHIKTKFTNAINHYYTTWPERLWGYSDENDKANQ